MEENSLGWERTAEVLGRYAETIKNTYISKLNDSKRWASGDLIRSVETEVTINGQTIQVGMSLANYWKYVEWDTRPHYAPITPLIEWVKVKRLVPRPMKNGKLPTPKQVAYMVQKKIAREGTSGSHDMAQSLEQTNAQFMNELKNAIREDIGGDVLKYMKILRLD